MNVTCFGCPFGCDKEETIGHLFVQCSVTRALWFASLWSIAWNSMDQTDSWFFSESAMQPENFLPVHADDAPSFFPYAAILLDHIWKLTKYYF